MSRSHAPFTETWWGVRSWVPSRRKVKFYGCYPRGFLGKARRLVLNGLPFDAPVLHMCSGLVRFYEQPGCYGPNDKCMDLDPSLEPDILADARDPAPTIIRPGRRSWLIHPIH
jgi:hypothetical protein